MKFNNQNIRHEYISCYFIHIESNQNLNFLMKLFVLISDLFINYTQESKMYIAGLIN